MTAVAHALGACGATAALYGRSNGIPVLVASSDPTAKTAYNLETSTGEGPITTTAAEGWPVHAAGPELPARWPKYGTAAGRLGVSSVTAVPLRLPSIQLGVLCCYGDRPMARDDVAAVNVIAGALAPILLRTAPGESLHDLMESPRSVRDNWIM